MQLLDQALCQTLVCPVDDKIDATEMVGSLNDVINAYTLAIEAYGIGLEYITRLLVGLTATLYMIGVVCKVDLRFVINAAFELRLFLFAQYNEQRHRFALTMLAAWHFRIGRNIPSFTHKVCTFNPSMRTIIPHGA